MTAPRNIEIRIQELELRGLPRHDRDRLVEALKRELASRAESARLGTPVGGGRSARVAGGTFDLAPRLSPEELGRAVARSVWSSCEQSLASPTGGPERRHETGEPQ